MSTRAWRRLWDLAIAGIEWQERLLLLNRPWEEELTHWASDGQHWTLHGTHPPPVRTGHHSTTSTGWCPGRRHRANAANAGR